MASDFIEIEKELRRLDRTVVALIRESEEQRRLLHEILRALKPQNTYPLPTSIAVSVAP
jgi:septal ring factor EnvC (AmiA/AmiB activator)